MKSKLLISLLFLIFSVTPSLSNDKLNVFSRSDLLFIWPVQGVKFARDPGQLDRKTVVYTIDDLNKERSQGRLELASVAADFSSVGRYANLNGICVLTRKHISGHNAAYKSKFGSDLKDIPIIDQYATRSNRRFTIELDAKLDAGFLSHMFPKLSFSGSVKVKLVSKNARDRFIERKSDRDFLFNIVRNGPVCEKEKFKQYKIQEKYFVDNYTYGDFTPEVTVKTGFLGLRVEVEYGEDLHGAFIFRP